MEKYGEIWRNMKKQILTLLKIVAEIIILPFLTNR
ncbi:Uncharacterised protein [Streptococcus pneumoniae]|nr:Uncharacterised protein [Streptococcus pneumoniae]